MCTLPLAPGTQPDANAGDRRELLKIVVAASLVNGLEIYDFTVFGFFAAVIGDQFFPAANPMTSLLLAVGTFGVGFFMRPLGAAIVGAYADRVGRRAAMITTSWMMALATAAIAFCPPFATIGLAAPLIIVVARLLQGFAAGGEVGAAATFVMETAPISRRGYRISWQLASQGMAALLGASLGTLLTGTMTSASLASWGWRIPFLIGLLIAPVGLYVRLRLREAPLPGTSAIGGTGDTDTRTPLVELCRDHGRTLLLATLMIMGRTVPFYAIVLYMPSYLSRVMHMPARTEFIASTFASLLLVVFSLLSGLLADRMPRLKPLVLLTSGCTALLIYPVFLMITHAHTTWPIVLGASVISALLALSAGAGTVLVLEALPARVRASGLSISYATGVALFGGTAPFIVTGLIKWTGAPMSPAWYVAPICVLSFLAVVLFREQRREQQV